MHPVSCGRKTIQESGRSKCERARADGSNSNAALVGFAQGFEQSGGWFVLSVGTSRDDDRVGANQISQPGLSIECEALGRADRFVLYRAELHAVPPGHREILPRPTKDLTRNGQLEQWYAGGNWDPDSVHGRNLSQVDSSASGQSRRRA